MSTAAPSHAATRASVRGAPRRSGAALGAVVLGAAAILPLLLSEGSSALDIMVLAAAYVVMALGLNVVVGFAGLLDLGYVAFFAIGAHVAAYFGSAYWANAAGGAGIALFAGEPAAGRPGSTSTSSSSSCSRSLRRRAPACSSGCRRCACAAPMSGSSRSPSARPSGRSRPTAQDIHLFGGSLTAGPNGITPIDSIDLPFIAPFGALHLRPWYWFALALVGLMLLVNFRLRDSRMGRAWIALRDDEEAAASAGVPIAHTKLQAYGVGAALGGVSGAFLASYLRTVNPDQFTFSFSIFILAMVVIGGLGSIWGVVVGAITLTAINTYLLPTVLMASRRGGAGLRPVGDLVRHLRLPAADHHAPATARAAAGTPPQDERISDVNRRQPRLHTGATGQLSRSSRRTITVSPAPLPMALRTSALTGSL